MQIKVILASQNSLVLSKEGSVGFSFLKEHLNFQAPKSPKASKHHHNNRKKKQMKKEVIELKGLVSKGIDVMETQEFLWEFLITTRFWEQPDKSKGNNGGKQMLFSVLIKLSAWRGLQEENNERGFFKLFCFILGKWSYGCILFLTYQSNQLYL